MYGTYLRVRVLLAVNQTATHQTGLVCRATKNERRVSGMEIKLPDIVTDNDEYKQIGIVIEEIGEVAKELRRGHTQKAAEECMDCVQACFTLLTKLEKAGADITAAREFVVKKNTERGYYGRGV